MLDCEIFKKKLEAYRSSAAALVYWGLASAVCTVTPSTGETQREFKVPSLGPGTDASWTTYLTWTKGWMKSCYSKWRSLLPSHPRTVVAQKEGIPWILKGVEATICSNKYPAHPILPETKTPSTQQCETESNTLPLIILHTERSSPTVLVVYEASSLSFPSAFES